MPTIKKGTIEYHIHSAPESPLNLKMGVIYGPKKRDEYFDGFSCVEIERGYFVVEGWGRGRTATLWEGVDLMRAYAELATLIGFAK